jgi:endonuclease YncB( thermonuclease family)
MKKGRRGLGAIARIFAAALAALVLSACGDRAELDKLALFDQGRAVRAISPDAFMLEDGRTVRLTGVSGPLSGDPHHQESQSALQALVAGRDVELLSGGARQDAYGRILAHVRRKPDGRWIQSALLDQGAVRVRTWPDNRALATMMLDSEAKARRRDRGLWALAAYRVLLPQEAVNVRGFAVVEGWAAAVRPGRFGHEIVLSDGGPGIVLIVPPRAADDFRAAGKAPDALAGRLVRARGNIWSDRSMRLDHPELLEVMEN